MIPPVDHIAAMQERLKRLPVLPRKSYIKAIKQEEAPLPIDESRLVDEYA